MFETIEMIQACFDLSCCQRQFAYNQTEHVMWLITKDDPSNFIKIEKPTYEELFNEADTYCKFTLT